MQTALDLIQELLVIMIRLIVLITEDLVQPLIYLYVLQFRIIAT